ncbi:MAG: hypothetical protein NVSMB18_00880 [Acetobacteraceae bacterium]
MTLDLIPWAAELAVLARQYGPATAVTDLSGDHDFAALAALAGGLAARLRAEGAAPGDPVATCLANGFAAAWASAGLRVAGLGETGLNPAYTQAERARCLTLSGARLVVTDAEQAPSLAALGCTVIQVGEIAPDADALDRLPPVPGTAWGRIGFTSGTTGRPKAIVHTHAARWVANLLQRASLYPAPGPGDCVLLATPFTHGAGLLAQAFYESGARTLVLPGIDLERIAALLDAGTLTHLFAPPTVLAKLTAAFTGRRCPSIKTVFCGTAPLQPALYRRARAIFGPTIRLTYGKTEIVNPITILRPEQTDQLYGADSHDPAGCVGFPASGVEVFVRDEHGRPCPPGTTGQVFLRARHMLAGHIDAAGFHATPEGGCHDTGDLGVLDAAGRLHLAGRLADVMKSGGYKIHPDEVERALAPAAGSGHIAIVSLPSEHWGEVLVAVGEDCPSSWVEQAASGLRDLARYKHPRAFTELPALPRNAQGKVVRRAIRDELLRRYTLIDGPHPHLEARPSLDARLD